MVCLNSTLAPTERAVGAAEAKDGNNKSALVSFFGSGGLRGHSTPFSFLSQHLIVYLATDVNLLHSIYSI
jgi:hypothetical protein